VDGKSTPNGNQQAAEVCKPEKLPSIDMMYKEKLISLYRNSCTSDLNCIKMQEYKANTKMRI
jgi:hypothetical protein